MQTVPLAKIVKDLLKSNLGAQEVFFNSGAPDFEDTLEDYEEKLRDLKSSMSELGIHWAYEDNKGGEGQGEEYWSVYSFSNQTEVIYVKFKGWYYSYDGSTYDGMEIVKPVVKSITVFE